VVDGDPEYRRGWQGQRGPVDLHAPSNARPARDSVVVAHAYIVGDADESIALIVARDVPAGHSRRQGGLVLCESLIAFLDSSAERIVDSVRFDLARDCGGGGRVGNVGRYRRCTGGAGSS